MLYSFVRRRGGILVGTSTESSAVNDPMQLLAAEIVVHAITDWRALVRSRAWEDDYPSRRCNFDELRIFFNSEWCEFLLQGFDMDPVRILDILEAELQAAKLQAEKKTRRRK
jgi:hypothetical protein